MAKAFIKYNFTAVTDQIIAVWYENTAPTAEIDRYVIDGTIVPKSGGFTATPLQAVMHQFRFYQSTDGIALETLLLTLDIDPSQESNESVIEFITFTVDDGMIVGDGNPAHISPVNGATSYFNDNLAASDIADFHVQKAGYGFLEWDSDIQKEADGGFTYINGDAFIHDEKYLVMVVRKVTISTPAILANRYLGVIPVSANFTFGLSYYSYLLVANWSTPVGTITIPAMSSIPANKILALNTHGGSQNNVRIVCNGTDTISFLGENYSVLNIGKGEEIEIYFDGTDAYVIHYRGDYTNLGLIRYGYKALLNELQLNGQEINVADYPRAKEYYDSLPSSSTTTYALWSTSQSVVVEGNTYTRYPYKGKFALSVDGLKIRIPDYRDISIHTAKYFDGTTDSELLTQGEGGFGPQALLKHKHKVYAKASGASGGGSLVDGADDGQGTQADSSEAGSDTNRLDRYVLLAFIKI